MRKASALVGALFLMAATFVALALPAGAQAYPPLSTTSTTRAGTTTTTGGTTTTSAASSSTTQGTSPGTTAGTTAAPTASQSAANLAFTGSDSQPLLIVGIVAVTLGAVILVAARRRTSVRATKGSS